MSEAFSIIGHQLTVISSFGNNLYFVTAVVIILAFYLLFKSNANAALVVLFTTTSYIYSIILKYVFKLERPVNAVIDHYTELDHYAFPSTHVIFYTVFWGYLLYLTYKYMKKSSLALHILRVFCLYFLLTVGVSRIYVGAHYLRDIIGGYAFGVIYLVLLIFLDMYLDKVFNKDKR